MKSTQSWCSRQQSRSCSHRHAMELKQRACERLMPFVQGSWFAYVQLAASRPLSLVSTRRTLSPPRCLLISLHYTTTTTSDNLQWSAFKISHSISVSWLKLVTSIER